RVDMVLVHGQPMLEVAAQLGHALTFPFRRYAQVLQQIEAIGASAIVPSAAGTVHTQAYAWLNAIVYPVEEARFCRDIARVSPRSQVFSSRLGGRYRISRGEVVREPDAGAELFERLEG